ncbi:MAG: hypothetical protein WCK31_03365, partial [bacterium]
MHESKFSFDKSKIKHFLVLVILFVLGLNIVILLKPSYLENILIVYLPGLIYSFFLLKKSRLKIFLFAICSILFVIPVEILARNTNSWDVTSTLPRILGIAPTENVIYALINIIYPISFYELFYDNDRNSKVSSRWKILLLMYLLLFLITITTYLFSPSTLQISYWMLGVAILVPVLI